MYSNLHSFMNGGRCNTATNGRSVRCRQCNGETLFGPRISPNASLSNLANGVCCGKFGRDCMLLDNPHLREWGRGGLHHLGRRLHQHSAGQWHINGQVLDDCIYNRRMDQPSLGKLGPNAYNHLQVSSRCRPQVPEMFEKREQRRLQQGHTVLLGPSNRLMC